MTGPEHYAEAERLLTLADRHSSGAAYGPEWALTLTAAQAHATLSLAAPPRSARQARTAMRGPRLPPPSAAPQAGSR